MIRNFFAIGKPSESFRVIISTIRVTPLAQNIQSGEVYFKVDSDEVRGIIHADGLGWDPVESDVD